MSKVKSAFELAAFRLAALKESSLEAFIQPGAYSFTNLS